MKSPGTFNYTSEAKRWFLDHNYADFKKTFLNCRKLCDFCDNVISLNLPSSIFSENQKNSLMGIQGHVRYQNESVYTQKCIYAPFQGHMERFSATKLTKC